MVVMAKNLKHIVEEQEVHTLEVLAYTRDLGDFSSQGCKCFHMVH